MITSITPYMPNPWNHSQRCMRTTRTVSLKMYKLSARVQQMDGYVRELWRIKQVIEVDF